MAGSAHSASLEDGHLLSRLRLRQLRLLVSIAEHGSIMAAASALHMTQPAATKTIRDLERDLGLELFHRSSRGVTPTVYGETLLGHARHVLAELRQAGEVLQALQTGDQGRVAIGAALSVTPELLPLSLARVKAERPGLSIKVVESTNDRLIPMLENGDLDMVVGRLPVGQEAQGLTCDVLFKEPIRVVARRDHPLSRRRKLTLADLAELDWILPLSGTSLREQVETAFRAAGLTLASNAVESVSVMTNHGLLCASDMIAVMPAQLAQSFQRQGQLKILAIELDWDLGPVGIVQRRRSAVSAGARALVDGLREVAVELKLAR